MVQQVSPVAQLLSLLHVRNPLEGSAQYCCEIARLMRPQA